jgi:hypothetical protein
MFDSVAHRVLLQFPSAYLDHYLPVYPAPTPSHCCSGFVSVSCSYSVSLLLRLCQCILLLHRLTAAQALSVYPAPTPSHCCSGFVLLRLTAAQALSVYPAPTPSHCCSGFVSVSCSYPISLLLRLCQCILLLLRLTAAQALSVYPAPTPSHCCSDSISVSCSHTPSHRCQVSTTVLLLHLVAALPLSLIPCFYST